MAKGLVRMRREGAAAGGGGAATAADNEFHPDLTDMLGDLFSAHDNETANHQHVNGNREDPKTIDISVLRRGELLLEHGRCPILEKGRTLILGMRSCSQVADRVTGR